ncbi:hypothetical protein GCM10020256_70260 [Streptomyces thermocoprophilus]
MAGLGGLRWFSYMVFTPLLVTNAISYGPVGAILVVESWLVGVGFVVYGGAMLGRLLCERFGHLDKDVKVPGGNGGGQAERTARGGSVRARDLPRRPGEGPA